MEVLETLLLEVCQERDVAEREHVGFLDLLADRKILEEECVHLRQLNWTLNYTSMMLTKPPCDTQNPPREREREGERERERERERDKAGCHV